MIDLFPYTKRYKYPHMKPRDIAIWERFIEKNPEAYDTCQYDFHVGDPPPFNPMDDDNFDRNQDALYKLKIDVIGHATGVLDIIELKPDAGPSTIGQVEGYKSLYVRDEEPKLPVGLVIITDRLRPNMDYLCKEKGIKLFVV